MRIEPPKLLTSGNQFWAIETQEDKEKKTKAAADGGRGSIRSEFSPQETAIAVTTETHADKNSPTPEIDRTASGYPANATPADTTTVDAINTEVPN